MDNVLEMAFADAVEALQTKKDRLEALLEQHPAVQVKGNKILDNVDERLRYAVQEEDNLSQFWKEIELSAAISDLEEVAELMGG
jgi:hypothetical protein